MDSIENLIRQQVEILHGQLSCERMSFKFIEIHARHLAHLASHELEAQERTEWARSEGLLMEFDERMESEKSE